LNVLPNHAIITVGVVDLLLHGLNVRWCDRVSRKISTLGTSGEGMLTELSLIAQARRCAR